MPSEKNGTLPKQSATSTVNTTLLKERAYTELKRHILDGTFPPGSFLSERRLAEELGMSKTPVKAALERLEHEGLIAVSPQQGIVVRGMSIADIVDHYEIRAALETFTVRTLAGKLNVPQVERLQTNLSAQAKLNPIGDVLSAAQLDAEFHQLFSEFLGNREISRVIRELRGKMGLVIVNVFQTHPDRVRSSYFEHLGITEAVLQGNGVLAAKLMEDHLEYGKGLILTRRS